MSSLLNNMQFKHEYNRNEIEKIISQQQLKMRQFHKHSLTCGHVRIIHGDHMDYIVDGHLHFPHLTHCDDHGPIEVLSGYSLV